MPSKRSSCLSEKRRASASCGLLSTFTTNSGPGHDHVVQLGLAVDAD